MNIRVNGMHKICNGILDTVLPVIGHLCFVLVWKFLLKEIDRIGHLSLNLTVLSCGPLGFMV